MEASEHVADVAIHVHIHVHVPFYSNGPHNNIVLLSHFYIGTMSCVNGS